ncbi:UDP-N-acetylglucosamine 2-epimerase [Phaeocystidibacter luteus]|uniref:UDP-N-acetylglucosamine 2-epimerase (Hydrolyzing) n=1 Tax=Phaeocystidibacter luteus TaxID=911197 RepID=A0A6N6RJ06_9FLAO|nr:UDP-N-acetylglucosamine 2-epimerase [Phaeocystidibacter luteus]KAB2814320.1 UDP-N-acetylglucosamine 2-epimerase (hydrolyzing) [Phaeocystidibacter luteus]
MSSAVKNIAVLTSSRADYGIYKPLLDVLAADNAFNLQMIVFGSHLSEVTGYTLQHIERDGFTVIEKVDSILLNDDPLANSTSTALTAMKFADVWARLSGSVDLVLALGDRFEMYAAVMASVPFGIPIGHLHGGETTLGAIDNVYRDCITLASTVHFTSTKPYAARVSALVGSEKHIYPVGSLSLDGLSDLELDTVEEFKAKWGIDLDQPTVVATYHPETVNFNSIDEHVAEWIKSIKELLKKYQVILGPPNLDTHGSRIRAEYSTQLANEPNLFIIESLGKKSYFTALKHCSFVIGNSSSGIIEVASFGKYAVNVGNRQEGRACGENVLHTPFDSNRILQKVEYIESQGYSYKGENIYERRNVAQSIRDILKRIL